MPLLPQSSINGGSFRSVSYEEGDDLKYEVVWSANECATGVHEALWSANGWWPDKPASERLRLAEIAVQWALDRGLITLHYDDSDDARPLAPQEIPERLSDWRTWSIPDGPELYFWRTELGRRWIRDKPVPRSWVRRTWTGVERETGDVEFPDLA
jgi:hypothetical protein